MTSGVPHGLEYRSVSSGCCHLPLCKPTELQITHMKRLVAERNDSCKGCCRDGIPEEGAPATG
jgi:hypothetical protein